MKRWFVTWCLLAAGALSLPEAAGAAVAAAEEPEPELELPEEPQPANRAITITTAISRHMVFFMIHFSFSRWVLRWIWCPGVA